MYRVSTETRVPRGYRSMPAKDTGHFPPNDPLFFNKVSQIWFAVLVSLTYDLWFINSLKSVESFIMFVEPISSSCKKEHRNLWKTWKLTAFGSTRGSLSCRSKWRKTPPGVRRLDPFMIIIPPFCSIFWVSANSWSATYRESRNLEVRCHSINTFPESI